MKIEIKVKFSATVPHSAAARPLPMIASTHLFCWAGSQIGPPHSLQPTPPSSEALTLTYSSPQPGHGTNFMFTSCARPMDQSEASRGCRGRNTACCLKKEIELAAFLFPPFVKFIVIYFQLRCLPSPPKLISKRVILNSTRQRMWKGGENGERGEIRKKRALSTYFLSPTSPQHTVKINPLCHFALLVWMFNGCRGR